MVLFPSPASVLRQTPIRPPDGSQRRKKKSEAAAIHRRRKTNRKLDYCSESTAEPFLVWPCRGAGCCLVGDVAVYRPIDKQSAAAGCVCWCNFVCLGCQQRVEAVSFISLSFGGHTKQQKAATQPPHDNRSARHLHPSSDRHRNICPLINATSNEGRGRVTRAKQYSLYPPPRPPPPPLPGYC